MRIRLVRALMAAMLGVAATSIPLTAHTQRAPTQSEASSYEGLFASAHSGDIAALREALNAGADLEDTDSNGRNAVHIAAFASHEDVVAILAEAGADMNALDGDKYDAVTIAAVANDTEMLRAAIQAGNSPGNVTSIYDGTALIAAAHLGHHEVVKILIDAGAPLDHVNNLGWTAMIEAVVLGDGGADHQKTLRYLVHAGADASITDRAGQTPLDLAKARGYAAMIDILEKAR